MIKIFQLITSINLGGAENVAFNLTEHCQIKSELIDFVIIELYKTKSDYANVKRDELHEKK